MLRKSRRADGPIIGDLLLGLFRRECEMAVMRRLIVSMALAIPPENMPDDECFLLSSILDGDP